MKLKIKIIAMLLLLLSSFQLKAQTNDTSTPWYVGAKIGAPIGVSTFSSFGAGKTGLSISGGFYGGYTINKIFSAEVSASFGNMALYPSSCSGDYWLNASGTSNFAPILGENGYYYKDIYSSVMLQQYGLHFNVELISAYDYFFKTNTKTRFSVMLSPAIYGVITQSTIKTNSNKNVFINNKSQFGFGYGADLSVGYAVTDNLTISLSSGINSVIGENFSNIPDSNHKSNFIINNDISVTWYFGKR